MREQEKSYTGNWPNSLWLIVILLVSACELIQVKNESTVSQTNKPLARVKDKYLYVLDIQGVVPKDANPLDSVNTVKRYIQNWIKKQLMITEAESNIEYDQAEIQRKMLDYRYALLVYEYEKLYINKNLSTKVNDEELAAYYQKNKDKFLLKQNILRGIFLQLPKDSNKKNDIKRLMNLKSEKSKSQLRTLSLRFATKSHLEDTIWLKFDDMFQNTPEQNTSNRVQFLRENQNRVIETSDDNFVYLYRIDEFKIQDEISPLEFVKDEIRNIIINKRKTELTEKLEQDVYDAAVKNKQFEVYVEE